MVFGAIGVVGNSEVGSEHDGEGGDYVCFLLERFMIGCKAESVICKGIVRQVLVIEG